MVVKNIVNIQNNKIDFDINGTNSLRYSFRGTEHFRLSEVDGTSHVQFIAQKAQDNNLFERQITEATNADFIGRISNIDNHRLTNLKDVVAINPAAEQALIYNGTNWEAGDVSSTLIIEDDAGSTFPVDLLSERLSILGTPDEIETRREVFSTAIIIGLPDRVIITDTLKVGIVSGADASLTSNSLALDGTRFIFQSVPSDIPGQKVGIINDSQQIALQVAGTNKLVISTNQVKVDNGANLLVTGDATIEGNLIVNGTQTIINTEIKLIEDPLIELGYAGSNALAAPQNIGFFGQYETDEYAGLYYDVEAAVFKVFDSLGANDYETSLATNGNIVTTNARSANIKAKKFITDSGDFGQEIYASDLNLPNGPTGDNPNIIEKLQGANVYGTGNGIFSGKLLSYIYNTDFSITASSLINYNFHVGGTNPSQKVFVSAVELETKIGDINFINFDSDTNVVTAVLSSVGAYKFRIRILPLLTWRSATGGGGGGESSD